MPAKTFPREVGVSSSCVPWSLAAAPRLTAALVLILALSAHHCAAAGSKSASSATVGETKKKPAQQWMFPILRNGPNNQKRDLRNALAMAKKFKTGIILTGLVKHYRENLKRYQVEVDLEGVDPELMPCFPDNPNEWGYMQMEQVLDRDQLDEWVPSATVQELKEQGWDGQLDAIVYPEDQWLALSPYIDRAFAPVDVRVGPETVHITTPYTFMKCNGTLMKALTEAMRPHRYIGLASVLMAHHTVPNLLKEDNVEPDEGTCRHAMYKANRLLRRAPWIGKVAQQFVQQVFQDQPYLAVHVRPYADKCLDEWRRVNSSDTSTLDASQCLKEHQDLHLRMARCMRSIMQRDNLTKVYVMAHPALQYMISQMLAKEGITDIASLGVKQLIDLSGCLDTSTTYLSMVEEEIAAQSTSFLGTTWSSITHSIAYERMGLNLTLNDYWEAITC